MIASDSNLCARLFAGDIVVDPIESWVDQVQPASIDVRLGGEFEWLSGETENYPRGEPVRIEPDEFVLGTTHEWVSIPDDLLARLEGRSSVGRLGLEVHSTAGIIDPGFEGEVTLEIYNKSSEPAELVIGQRVGQLIFQELDQPAVRPYGDDRGSKYQGQTGPQQSRLEEDRDLASTDG